MPIVAATSFSMQLPTEEPNEEGLYPDPCTVSATFILGRTSRFYDASWWASQVECETKASTPQAAKRHMVKQLRALADALEADTTI